MIACRFFRSRVFVLGLVAAFALLLTPVREFAQAKAPAAAPSGSLVGFIYEKDMNTPVAKAVVKIRDISSAKVYESAPTDTNGMYNISGIHDGRYILGVTTVEGNYNFDYALVIKGSDMAKLSVALTAGGKTTGADAAAKSFFSSTSNVIGVAIFVAGVAFMTYLILHKPSEEASPIR